MMGQVISKQECQKIERALQKAKGDDAQYRRIQIVHLRAAHGMTQEAIAHATGVSRSTVSRIHMAWFRDGLKGLDFKPRGGRINENMSREDEATFLKGFIHQAGAGELVCTQDIHTAYEQKIGHKTGSTAIYSLLERHGWRKLMPRPHHPRRDIKAQNRFKKKFKRLIGKAKRDAAERHLPLRVMFQDEARFGRLNSPRACWAPKPVRPAVAAQATRQYT